MTWLLLRTGWGSSSERTWATPPVYWKTNNWPTLTDWSRRRTNVRRVLNFGSGSGYLTHFANRWCPMNGDAQELWWGFDGRCTRIANERTDAIGSSRRSNPNKSARVCSWNSLFLFVLLWRLVCFRVRFCGKGASFCCSNSNNGYSFGQARCRQEAYQEVQAHAAWPQNLCQGLFSLFCLAPSSPFSPLLTFLSCASLHGKDVMLASLYHLSEEEDEEVPALLLLAEGPRSLSSYFLVIIAIRFHLSRKNGGVLSTSDDSLFPVSLFLA